MSNGYRVEPVGNAFIVIDDLGEPVGRFPTEEEAQKDIERCLKEDQMWESAKRLVDAAIKAHMEKHGVDRETSAYWINSALGGA